MSSHGKSQQRSDVGLPTLLMCDCEQLMANAPSRNVKGAFLKFGSLCNVIRCREHGVGILAHSVLGKGLCTGKHSADHIFSDDDERSRGGYAQDFSGDRWRAFCAATDKLKAIADRRGYTCAELAVGWVSRACACIVCWIHLGCPARLLEVWYFRLMFRRLLALGTCVCCIIAGPAQSRDKCCVGRCKGHRPGINVSVAHLHLPSLFKTSVPLIIPLPKSIAGMHATCKTLRKMS
jgi:hypothetical protein